MSIIKEIRFFELKLVNSFINMFVYCILSHVDLHLTDQLLSVTTRFRNKLNAQTHTTTSTANVQCKTKFNHHGL